MLPGFNPVGVGVRKEPPPLTDRSENGSANVSKLVCKKVGKNFVITHDVNVYFIGIPFKHLILLIPI